MSPDDSAVGRLAASRSSDGPFQDFLQRLRRRLGPPEQETPLPSWPCPGLREVGPGDDLPSRFVAAAEEAGCSVHRVTEENWLQVTVGLLTRAAARRVAVQCQPGTALTQDRAGAVREALAGKGVSTTDKCDDDTLFSVDAAVTGVIAAIAETGTVICVSGQSSARGVSLIPPVHVALVAGSQLAGDLFDAFGRWHGQLLGCPCWLAGTASLEAGRGTRHPLPANVNLITGPSKTADIEGVLVTGMHGPGAVHVVLLEGE